MARAESGLKGWTLIAGASEGLGLAFARIAAAEGRDLILAARQAQKMERLADELRARHKIAVEVIATDLADSEQVELLWRRASTRRRIDILVNNAGLGAHQAFASPDFAREDASIRVNVLALTILMKRAVPHMQAAGGGRILNLGSIAGFVPGPGMAVYHATKAYVLSLGEAVAEELRGTSVSVTTLCPGAAATHFAAGAGMEKKGPFAKSGIPSAESVAKAGWAAMKAGRVLYVPGFRNRLNTIGPRFIPRRMMARIVASVLK
jgi:short-subunit dehydrogenase